jgi:hypothetical protein
MNTPDDVAKYIIQVTADPKAHGKALFVTGGNAVDIEEGLNRTEPEWLGEKNSRELNEGQVILGLVSFLVPTTNILASGSGEGCLGENLVMNVKLTEPIGPVREWTGGHDKFTNLRYCREEDQQWLSSHEHGDEGGGLYLSRCPLHLHVR